MCAAGAAGRVERSCAARIGTRGNRPGGEHAPESLDPRDRTAGRRCVVARSGAGDHLRRARRRPPSVGRPRRPLRRAGHADPALQRLAALSDPVPHRGPLHRAGRRDGDAGAVARAHLVRRRPDRPRPRLPRRLVQRRRAVHRLSVHEPGRDGHAGAEPGLERRADGAADERRGRGRDHVGLGAADDLRQARSDRHRRRAAQEGAQPEPRPDDRRLRRPGREAGARGGARAEPRVGRAARQEAEGHGRLERDVLRAPRQVRSATTGGIATATRAPRASATPAARCSRTRATAR